MKKLEAASAEQQQQAEAQAQATSTALTEAQLAAAAYYQAQFMLLANSAASTPSADDSTGATLDNNALSEYYRKLLGCVWNDRTPTSSDAEDAGTPLPSDKEDEKEEQHPHTGEVQASSDQPSELKTKDKGTSKGERERCKVKRRRKHKRVSTEDPSSAMATETNVCGAKQNEADGYHKPLGGPENSVVGSDHKICNSPGDNRTNDHHQSDNFMDTSTDANTCTHSTTNRAGLMSEAKNHHSPPREKPSPKEYREDKRTKELHRIMKEPHREIKEPQRLYSSSQSPTISPNQRSMNDQHQSSQDMTVYHSADRKEVNYDSCSPKGEKQLPRKQRRDRENKELQRGMKEYRGESMDVQGLVGDSRRENHIKGSHSSPRSPHSPTGTLNTGTKAHTRANGIVPRPHTPRIEKCSPKRHREDRETSKPYREMNEPYGEESRKPPRETRRSHRETREEYIEIRDGYREIRDTHRVMVEPHRGTRETNGDMRELHKEMKEPHREMKNPHRAMMEPARVTKEPHRDIREAHRGVRGTQRETRVAYKEIREPQRGTCTRETDRDTMGTCRDPHACRNIREPQSEIMELHRDRRMAQRERRETFGDRESSHDRRSHSSSRLSSSSRHRSRSPSYDKENIGRPPSLSREGRPRGEPTGTRSDRANSLERSSEDLSSRRRLNRKRKLSSPSRSASQHGHKQTRRESYQQDIKQTKDRHSQHSRSLPVRNGAKLQSSRLASPVWFSNFDDITTPPTPNADEILPYSADVRLCENSAVSPYDDSGAKGNMSDVISYPPTPTNELHVQGHEEEEQTTNEDTEREPNTKDGENKPQANLNIKQTNDNIVELNDPKKPESCVDGGDNPLHVASDHTTVLSGSESKMENVENEDKDKNKVSDLEEGEITDSDSDSGGETESALRQETRGDDGPGTRVEKRQVNISGNYKSQEEENSKRSYCDHEPPQVDERRPRRSSCHGSVGHHHHRQKPSPRSSRHPPLSERRNRHSPPSVKKRTEHSSHVSDPDGRIHPHGDRHTHCHRSSRHLRSNCNLPDHIY